MKLTTYQRGNRDGLLSQAKDSETRIDVIEKSIETYEKELAIPNKFWARKDAVRYILEERRGTLSHEKIFLKRLLTAAEALPIDPEDAT